jgi:glutamine amidotransferase
MKNSLMNKIVIVDYGLGNIRSIKHKLEKYNYTVSLSNKANEIESAGLLILPGVGNFKVGMENIKNLDLIKCLNNAVLKKKKPIIGICLGMQLMTSYSEEGNCAGLNWINARTKKFFFEDSKFKIPNVGWRTNELLKPNYYFNQIPKDKYFYFTHSYYVDCKKKEDVIAQSYYGHKFTSVFQKDNIFGVQFHPEKSHLNGFRLLLNFIEKNL